jgi:hypothetical protein
MSMERSLESLPDEELLRRLADLLGRSRRIEADLVAHIGEVDRRRLFSRAACPSMFAYCTEVLHLSEHEAYLRITVARAAREHPVLLVLLSEGRLHLAGIAKLAPHLSRENRDALLERAVHRSKREIEELVAELAPQPDARSLTRKLPEPPMRPLELGPDRALDPAAELGPDRGSDSAAGRGQDRGPEGGAGAARVDPCPRSPAPQPALIQPLAPARYRVQFTAGAALHDKLERLRALLRSEVPDGDLAAIIEKAVTEKLERLEARRHGAAKAPRKDLMATDTSPSSRHIPAAVRRAVRERDGGRCRYVDAQGRRCSERHRLEYHHRQPFGFGGDRSPRNICLMCRAHNRFMAEQDYGRETMARHSRSKKSAPMWTDRGP